MRRLSYVLAFMLLLSISAFGTGNGNVVVSITHEGLTGFDDVLLLGQTNYIDIAIGCDDSLGGASWGFEFTSGHSFDFVFHSNPSQTPGYVEQFNRAWVEYQVAPGFFIFRSCWDGTLSLLVGIDDASPDSILMGGAGKLADTSGNGANWYTAGPPELAYRMFVDIPDDGDTTQEFCIRPIFFPPAGTWTQADYVGGYNPDFNGQPTLSESNPDPSVEVCFPIQLLPCIPPMWTSTPGVAVSKNHCLDYDFNFVATEGGNQPPADPVTYSGDNISANGAFHVAAPGACGTDTFTVTASNTCGSSTDYAFAITWTNNDPTITNCPGPRKVAKGNDFSYTLTATDPDACDNFTWTVAAVGAVPVGSFSINNLGEFVFHSDVADGGVTYIFDATVMDDCGGTDVCRFEVEVLNTEPFVIKLTKSHNSLQGHYEYIEITKLAGSYEMGGFDFLVGYDASGLSFMSASLGAALGPDGLGWEYFTYRYGAFGNCGGPCPSGYLRVVAIADQNNGANHPNGFNVPNCGVLAVLKFYVTNDATYECQYLPIRFVWQDCGDNSISNVGGDTLFISSEVYSYDADTNWTQCGDQFFLDPGSIYNITGIDCGLGYGFNFGGACPGCEECHEFYPDGTCKNRPVRAITFWNGGVDIACADSIDARGDVNLNGIANEIADAVLFTNYFLYGIGVFDIAMDGQIAATDVNNDGLRLSVGDLVYLIRIITGDALPFPKLAPFANSAEIDVVNGALSTNAGSDIGAVYAVYKVDGNCEVVNHTDMQLVSNEVNGELRVLVYSGTENTTNRIPAGNNELFTIAGNADLVKVEVADYNGNLLTTHVNKTALPTQYALRQNVPNPFNPTTKITLELPTLTNWHLDIYNVAGQLVKNFTGTDQGVVNVEWDASNVASGVYFYKMTAGAFSNTKKMVLMK
jgi:hypothetical protein